jgi:hypothetical protein
MYHLAFNSTILYEKSYRLTKLTRIVRGARYNKAQRGLYLLQMLYIVQDYALLLARQYGIGCLYWHSFNLTTWRVTPGLNSQL